MLLRPILLHVAKYSEYISDRDTDPSGFVSKCAFSLEEKQTTDAEINTEEMQHWQSHKDRTLKIN